MTSQRRVRLYAVKILAEVQFRKASLYGEAHDNYSLKVFLTRVMTTP